MCHARAGTRLRLHRGHNATAIALTAIRMAAAGRLGQSASAIDGRSGPLWQVASEIQDTYFPERPDDDLPDTLVELLPAEATPAAASLRS